MHNTDSFLEIGSTHNICEDYVIHGDHIDMSYIAISDGCSSSPDTDIGSRIMCLSFRNAINSIMRGIPGLTLNTKEQAILFSQLLEHNMLENIRQAVDLFHIPSRSMDATLVASIAWHDKLLTFIWGDGHIRYDFVDGNHETVSINYESNAPFYLSYGLDTQRTLAYMTQYGSSQVIKKTTRGYSTTSIQTKIASEGTYNGLVSIYDLSDFNRVSVFSDGVESFRYSAKRFSDSNPPSDSEQAILKDHKKWIIKFTDFKNTNGEFVKRRMKKVSHENKKLEIEHFDDISIATMQVRDVEN